MSNNIIHKRIQRLEVLLALILILIPGILILFTGEVRASISDYAYSKADNLFSGLLWISAALFLYNGMYTNKWYNFVLATTLIGVSLTDHLEYTILHYTLAGLFFLGTMLVMVVYSSQKQRVYKVWVSLFMLVVLTSSILFKTMSLLVAEWICLAPISIHFIGESLNKID